MLTHKFMEGDGKKTRPTDRESANDDEVVGEVNLMAEVFHVFQTVELVRYGDAGIRKRS